MRAKHFAWPSQEDTDKADAAEQKPIDRYDRITGRRDWERFRGYCSQSLSPSCPAGDGRPEQDAAPATLSTTSSLPPGGDFGRPHIPSSQDHQGPSQFAKSPSAPAPSNPGTRRSVLARQAALVAVGIASFVLTVAILLALRGRS